MKKKNCYLFDFKILKLLIILKIIIKDFSKPLDQTFIFKYKGFINYMVPIKTKYN